VDWGDKMGMRKVWLFRILVVIAAVTMGVSFIMPWWIAKFADGPAINIYGWGLRHNLVQLADYVRQDVTPFYKTVLAWVYMAASIMLISLSTFIRRKASAFMLGSLGIIYITYALIAAFVVIANRVTDLSIRFQGITNLMVGQTEFILVHTSLQPGFYLALATGAFIILLAIIRFVLEKNKASDSI
jgi:hypothetical protein